MVGIELAPPPGATRWGRRVSAECVRRGVLIRPLGDVVVLMPILTSTEDEIERIVTVVAESITASMEYAVQYLGSALIVVLAHDSGGAVAPNAAFT